MRSAVEELGQGHGPALGVELVVLLDRHPSQLAALTRELVRLPRVLLLALDQLLASGIELLPLDNIVICHRVSSPSRQGYLWRRTCRSLSRDTPGIRNPSLG